MSDSHYGEPQYTEKEVSAILKRAAELQGDGAKATGGTSLTQLQQAAAEIGIDPSMVQRAADELASSAPRGPGAAWLGGPWGVDYDKLLPGVIDENSWPGVVEDLRSATGRVGTPKQVGKGYEFLSNDPDTLHVTFTPSGSSTRVRVTARFGEWGAVFYVLPSLFALFISVITTAVLAKHGLMTPQLALTILFGVPSATLIAGRAGFGRVAKKKRLQTQRLISRLETSLAASAQQIEEAARTHAISYAPPQEQSAFTLQTGTRRE